MSASGGRRQPPTSEIARLVEPQRPPRPERAAVRVGDQELTPSSPATGLDDVRAPLAGDRDAAASTASQGQGVSRRDLLSWGAAAALIPLLPSTAHAAATAATASGRDEPLRSMSVGYVEGSDTWPTFDRLSLVKLNRGHRPQPGSEALPFSVMPADQMVSGDQRLAGELVRVGIHGLYPVPAPQDIARLDLTVLFPSPDPASPAPLPFFAWSYFSEPGPNPSASLRFTAPLGVDGSLEMLLEVKGGTVVISRRKVVGMAPEPAGGSFLTNFTVDWYEGRPKLQRGVYLLALDGSTWSTSRKLPVYRPGTSRPIDLLSLIVSFEPAPPED